MMLARVAPDTAPINPEFERRCFLALRLLSRISPVTHRDAYDKQREYALEWYGLERERLKKSLEEKIEQA